MTRRKTGSRNGRSVYDEWKAEFESDLALGMRLWADKNIGKGKWEAVGIADFYTPKSEGNSIGREAVLIDGRALDIGDDVEGSLCHEAPTANVLEFFKRRNEIPDNNWWNYKMIVWADGRIDVFLSFDVLDPLDPRQWAPDSEFTFGPFEEEPVLRGPTRD